MHRYSRVRSSISSWLIVILCPTLLHCLSVFELFYLWIVSAFESLTSPDGTQAPAFQISCQLPVHSNLPFESIASHGPFPHFLITLVSFFYYNFPTYQTLCYCLSSSISSLSSEGIYSSYCQHMVYRLSQPLASCTSWNPRGAGTIEVLKFIYILHVYFYQFQSRK